VSEASRGAARGLAPIRQHACLQPLPLAGLVPPPSRPLALPPLTTPTPTPTTHPNTSTGNAVSAAMVTHWVCNVAIGQNFMAWVDAFGLAAVYAGFAVASLLGAAYINANVPETKARGGCPPCLCAAAASSCVQLHPAAISPALSVQAPAAAPASPLPSSLASPSTITTGQVVW
jgi:hypothetical protein